MTFKQIYDLVAYQAGAMGSDDGLLDLDVDAITMVKQYINEGYDILIRDYYKPWHIQQTQLDANGMLDETLAAGDPHKILYPVYRLLNHAKTKENLEVSSYTYPVLDPLNDANMTAYSGLMNSGYNPVIGEPNEVLWIKYAHYMPHLSADSDVPGLPEQHHALLADYATWRYMSTGNQDKQVRAQFFWQRFLEGAKTILQYGANGALRMFQNLWTR